MSEDEKMTVGERRKVLRKIQKRYQRASRQEKSRLLDEMEKLLGMHRGAIGRLLNGDLARKPRTRQRGRVYGIEVQRVLMVIAESFDYVCAERLKPNLVWMAEHLETHGELETTPELLEKLARISASTIRRRLEQMSQDQPRLPRKGPQPALAAGQGKPTASAGRYPPGASPGMKRSPATSRSTWSTIAASRRRDNMSTPCK